MRAWGNRNVNHRRASFFTLVLSLGLMWLAAPALAQQAQEAEEPAEDTAEADDAPVLIADGEMLPIVIEAVQGMVQARLGAEEAFVTAEAGMELPVGAALRTGPRSAVRFRVGPTQRITLDRLGTVEVLEAIRREGRVTTDIGMEYGRTRYEVQSADDVEHSGQIRSPAATLAVSGSDGFLEDYADRPPRGGADSGTIAFVNSEGQFIELDPPSELEGDQTAGGEFQLAQGTLVRWWMALGDGEFELLGAYPAGTFEHWLWQFDAFHDDNSFQQSLAYFQDEFRGGGEQTFPGTLSFATAFNEDTGAIFEVLNAREEILTTDPAFDGANPTTTPSGGILVDRTGDGVASFEAVWEDQVPLTAYTARIRIDNGVEQITRLRGELLGSQGQVIDELEVEGFFLNVDLEEPSAVMTISLPLEGEGDGFQFEGGFLD